jgi:hypothetical protein
VQRIQTPPESFKSGEPVKTRTDRTDGQIAEQANGKTQESEPANLSTPQTAPDRSDRFTDEAANVRSVYLPPTTRQISDRSQTIDLAQQNIKSVRSVLSVHVFTSSSTEICAHCGQPVDGEPWDYDGVKVRLHAHCERRWIEIYEASRDRRLRLGAGSSQ